MPQRSHHYNWFRGQNNITDPKENFKQQAKTVWKFVKIFLYFMLFFFSMWGCVQVFTHRVSTKPASGITLTNGDDKLSPQVNEYIVDKNANDRFYFTRTGVNYVPNNKNEGLQTIANVNKQLKEDLDVKSPTKARKGGNYIIKLQDSNGKKIGATKNDFFAVQQNGVNTKNQNKMLIYTTANISNKENKYYSFENSLKILQTLAPNGITRYKINFINIFNFSTS